MSHQVRGRSHQHQHQHWHRHKQALTLGAACSCLGLVALGAGMFVAADIASGAYATTTTAESTTSSADGSSYVTISASDVTISLTPSNGDATAYTQTTVALESNSSDPVQLYLSMAGNTTALYKDGDTTSFSITATTGSGTLDSLDDNTWGYSTDGELFQAVPAASSDSSGNLIAELDSSGTTTQDIYYGIKVNSSSLPSGTYSNSVVYTATVSGVAISPTAELTSIEAFGSTTDSMIVGTENTITVTTNIKTNIVGEPRAYYTIDNGNSTTTYQECATTTAEINNDGYLTIICTVTPETEAAENTVTLYITAKGSEDDYYCNNGIYSANSSDCEAGNWKWGSFEVDLPAIVKTGVEFGGTTIYYMQNMTTDICAAAAEGDTVQLVDKRDDKTYWVAKLADGNCWMTQNLDFDLVGEDGSGSSVTLYASTSDVSKDTTLTAYYITTNSYGVDDDAIQTWDFGDYVIKDPTSIDGCSDVATLANCTNYFVNVEGLTARNYISDYTEEGTYSEESQTYDAHYLVGNYYSWYAATAGSGALVTGDGEQATDSICPKGWQLPLSGSDTVDYSGADGSFYKLLEAYGLTNSSINGDYNIALAPLYLMRGGVVDNPWMYAGSEGSYWSRVRSSSFSSGVYSLYLGSTGVNLLTSYYYYAGLSVRCVATSTSE